MDLKSLIKKIDLLKKEIDSLRPISKEHEIRIWQKFRLDWNFHSNNLEGNSLTYGETKALILFNITASGKPLKDHFEITGHNEALKYIEEVINQQRLLTETFIRELHTIILKEPYKKDAITPEGLPTTRTINIGVYKKESNHVKTISGEIFYFAKPEETPALMQELMEWYNKNLNNADLHPLLFATEFHYKFIRIHPFDDGNGRMARILMNFILMMKNFPPIIIKTQEKAKYFRALEQADAGNIEAFIFYLGEQLINSLELYIKGARGEEIDEADDVDKQLALIKAKIDNTETEELSLKKSPEVLEDIYNNSLIPLLNSLTKELSKIDYFFLDKEIRFTILNRTHLIKDISDIKQIFHQISLKKENLDNIFIEYSWEGFKKGGLINYHSQKLNIEFNDYYYRIEDRNNNLILEKFYHQNLTQEEIKKLSKDLTKKVLNYIDQTIESKTKK